MKCDAGEASVANINKLRYANGKIASADLRFNLQKAMQERTSVFRTGKILQVKHYLPSLW